MKKILSVLLVLSIVCSAMLMVACDKDGGVDESISAKELISDAIEKTQNADSMAGKMTMSMTMSMMGMTIEVPMVIDMKIKNIRSDMPTAYADINIDMSALGMEQSMVMYMADGWGYYVMDGGESYKTYIGNSDTANGQYIDMANSMLEEIPDNILEGQKVIKNSDGTRSVRIELNNEDFMALYEDLAESMYGSMMGGMADISELNIDDVVITYTVGSDGYLTKCEMSFVMGVNVQGISTNTTVSAVMEYSSFDADDIVITPPEGYQNFPEM